MTEHQSELKRREDAIRRRMAKRLRPRPAADRVAETDCPEDAGEYSAVEEHEGERA